MHVVDADTHIVESEAVWDYLDEDMYSRRPVIIRVPNDTLYKTRNAFWLIDGNIRPKPAGRGGFTLHTPSVADRELNRTDTSLGSRELSDIGSRIQDMDRLGVSVQILYPTLFLVHLTEDPALEVALCQAYNRWMSHASAAASSRIKWIAVAPFADLEASLIQINYAQEHGAVGVLFRGMEHNRSLADPYFFPIYQEASRLGLAICIHTGPGSPALSNVFDVSIGSGFGHISLLPVIAFNDLITRKIPELFPDLRFGFIEASSSWVPYVVHKINRSIARDGGTKLDSVMFRDYRFYVACEADEDIPYLLNYIPEDNMMIGSDYGHIDPAAEPRLVDRLIERGDLTESTVTKILGQSATAFYGL